MSRSLVVDNFAGGGGASTGIEAAIGRPVDIAINHDAQAIAMHQANHPHTFHVQNDIWAANVGRLDQQSLWRGYEIYEGAVAG